jgi:hypothetical protein
MLHLSGTVTDNAGGSGVERVEIELLNHAGEHVSGPNVATLSGYAWNISITLDFAPTGDYIVRMSAQDKVGNLTSSDSSLLSFDNSPPQADITVTGSQTGTLSGIAPNLPTIAGTVSDIPYPNKPVLHLHFEENSGATSFQDGSGNFLDAGCTGNSCPTAGESGQWGGRRQHDRSGWS